MQLLAGRVLLLLAPMIIYHSDISYSLPTSLTVLNMKTQGLTCIDFDTLNQLKNLKEIYYKDANMFYFPDKDCSNSVPEEDPRILYLPELTELTLAGIKLGKVPNLSLMPKLEVLDLNSNREFSEIPGTPFANNVNLRNINFHGIKLSTAPNLTGGCGNIDFINLQWNSFASVPDNYFEGCSIRAISWANTYLTSFPNHNPLGSSLEQINLEGTRIVGVITSEMVKGLTNLKGMNIKRAQLSGVDVNFCHNSHLTIFDVDRNNNLEFFENPYRFCMSLVDTLVDTPHIKMPSTKIPCDYRRCWMKKLASKISITIDACPDGRSWSSVTEAELCSQG